MEISARDRRALGGLGVAFVMVLGYLFVVEPLCEKYEAMVTEHSNLAGRLSRIRRADQEAKYLAGKVAELEEKGIDLSPPTFYYDQVNMVSEKIHTAGQQTKTKLKSLKPATAKSFPDDRTLQIAMISLEGEGGWEDVFKFMAALNRIPGVLSVEKFKLKGKGGKLNLQMTVSVLVKAEPRKEGPWTK